MLFSKRNCIECDKCPAKPRCFYSYLDPAAQREWKTLMTSARLEDGEILFNEGDKSPGLFIVCSGSIKVCKNSLSGQQLISRIEHAGDLAGHIAFFAGGTYQGSGEAMGQTLVSLISDDPFLNFLRKYPNAALALIRALANDVRAGDNKAHDIAYKPAKSRMADALLQSAAPDGKKYIVRGVKRRELAEMSGLTVETAVRILAEFEKKKIIRREGKEIAVMNRDALSKVSQSDE